MTLPSISFLPGVDDPERLWPHAVDAPVGVADVVADRDGEAAKVGAYQVDGRPALALDVQRRALAPVLGPLVETQTWNRI